MPFIKNTFYLGNKWKNPSTNLWCQTAGAESFFGHSGPTTSLPTSHKSLFLLRMTALSGILVFYDIWIVLLIFSKMGGPLWCQVWFSGCGGEGEVEVELEYSTPSLRNRVDATQNSFPFLLFPFMCVFFYVFSFSFVVLLNFLLLSKSYFISTLMPIGT